MDHFFSEESEISIGGQRYSMRYKVIYEQGNIKNFIKYYPDGAIEYTNEELMSDTAIYSSIDIPFNQKWHIKDNKLFDDSENLNIDLLRLDEKHFLEKHDGRIFVIE